MAEDERFDRYKGARGFPPKQIESSSAAEIVGYIEYLAKDKREHPFMEDCISWLEFKMREIRKLVSHLESKPLAKKMAGPPTLLSEAAEGRFGSEART